MALSKRRAWRVALLGTVGVLVAAVLYQSGAFALPWANTYDEGVVSVTDAETGEAACVAVDVADTRPERVEGLGGRESLANGSGMWFTYDQPRNLTYVMRDMNFPIDVVFVGPDMRVTSVKQMRAPEPGEDGESIRASGYGQYVLEVPRGYANATGIDEGDAVDVTYGTQRRSACTNATASDDATGSGDAMAGDAATAVNPSSTSGTTAGSETPGGFEPASAANATTTRGGCSS